MKGLGVNAENTREIRLVSQSGKWENTGLVITLGNKLEKIPKKNCVFYLFLPRSSDSWPCTSFHSCLQSIDGVNFSNEDSGPKVAQSLRTAFSNITITSNNCNLS